MQKYKIILFLVWIFFLVIGTIYAIQLVIDRINIARGFYNESFELNAEFHSETEFMMYIPIVIVNDSISPSM